ncbi:ribose-phosphate diphosphokinase [Patescibacteria group bacterium]|nr:ribose-phosphate diphosphokinase [Patescibacteria group bacterium]
MSTLIFYQPSFQPLAKDLIKHLPNTKLGYYSLNRFANEELFILTKDKIKNKKCIIIGTIAPPDTNFLEIVSLAHTLKKDKVKHITLILPYFAYTRHDKDKPNESYITKLFCRIFQTAGIDKIITFDIHSDQAKNFTSIPIISIPTASILALVSQKHHLTSAEFISPDFGATKRTKAVKKLLHLDSNIKYFKKQRALKHVTCTLQNGHFESDQAIIIDDQLDTGGTLLCACEDLQKKGIKEIYIMVTHGLFTGTKWKKLFKYGVKKIFCTNTIPQKINDKRIKILSINSLLISSLQSMLN